VARFRLGGCSPSRLTKHRPAPRAADLRDQFKLSEWRRSWWYEAQGTLPPETVFCRTAQGEFDLVVAVHHDQRHIAAKTLGLEDAVNVTAGLPIVGTSVDHRTAFDLAGQDKASPSNVKRAILLAGQLSRC
jgi:4-hydroxy-L-threonine phosphate dehydrogenase PdxA